MMNNFIFRYKGDQKIMEPFWFFSSFEIILFALKPYKENILQSSMKQTELSDLIKTKSNREAKTILQSMMDDLEEIVDNQDSTLLHIATNNNNMEMAEYFLKIYDKKIAEEAGRWTVENKLKWINRKDTEGFTCIHYAVFRGNIKLAFLLEEHGADIYAINKQGLTVLHVAAQGDSPALMFYYLNKGMKIGATDSKGSTALHWACYSGMESSSYALLSWNAEIDLQEITYGNTPLHLAVMSGNGRIVRKLLIRGCDRSLRNFNGKSALDLANENEYFNIASMIIDKQGIAEFLSIKQPFRKVNIRTFPFYLLISLFLINYILNISFVVSQHFGEYWDLDVVFLSIGLLVAVLFIAICRKSPGVLYPPDNQNFFNLLIKNTPSKICFDCRILKPERSKHCQVCGYCVSVYDHHCPWVGNCVGARNYFLFYCFLISIWVFMTYTFIFQVINLQNIQWVDPSPLQIIRITCIFIGFACSILFFAPLTYLIYVQTRNTCLNQTTNQRYGFKNNKPERSTSSRTISQNKSSENLNTYLLKKQPSETASMVNQGSDRADSRLEHLRVHPGKNCMAMCFGNANNIRYQVGGIS